MSEPHVVNAFLNLYLEENLGGPARLVDHYQALFPGHEALIADLFERCRRQSDGEAIDSRIGQFQIMREIGRGGQGVVYLAEDTRLKRPVALKILTGLRAMTPNALDRLLREARIASRLDHPGICAVYEASVDAGIPYIAMQYVQGTSLAKRIATTGRCVSPGASKLPSSVVTFDDSMVNQPAKPASSSDASPLDRKELGRVVGTFEKVARALHAAHEVGIVHRDIKPGNIMIATGTEEPVLLDFGLAQDDSGEAGPPLTQTGDLFGTPAYMSPEQITGRRVRIDRRSDVYSLGVTLYECLTMRRPFEAPTRESLYQAILSKEPERARKLNRQIPSDLEVVLQCAMSKDRDKRYQTAADFAEDLRRVRDGEPILAKKVRLAGRAWRWSKRRPAAAALVCALALGIPAMSGLCVWYWTHRDDVKAQERARREELLEDALEAGFYELHEGSTDQAVVAFEKGLSLDPASAEAVVGLALARSKRPSPEAFQAALEVINQGERSVAAPGVFAHAKADILTNLGRDAEAAAAWASAPKMEGPLMWFLEGTRAIETGHGIGQDNSKAQPVFREAAEHLTRAVSGSPRARRAYHFQLAHALGHCRPAERNSALAIADVLAGLWPTSPRTWRWIGHVLEDVDPDRSLAACREATRLDFGWADSHVNLGRAFARQGKIPDAMAEYEQAIRLDARSGRARAHLGYAFAQQGKQEEAIAEYQKAIALDPKDPWTRLSLGAELAKQGKRDEAIPQYEEAMKLDRNDARAPALLGVILANQGKHEEAERLFRAAIALNPETARTHTNLGIALWKQGKNEAAMEEYRKAIGLDPKEATAHANLGSMLANQGKDEEGMKHLREAILIEPNYVLAHTSLGTALSKLGRLEDAETEYRRAIGFDPRYVPAQVNLGFMFARQGKLKEAIAKLGEVIQLEPDHFWAHRGLADALYQHGDLVEAVAMQEQALRLMKGKDVNGASVVDMENALSLYRDALEAAESKPSMPESRK
jgi:tetratricopeptide (TPR) repeat protein